MFLCCNASAVGVDANPRCLEKAVENEAVAGLPAHARVEWHFHDVTKLVADAFMPPHFTPHRCVIYLNIGNEQLEAMAPMLHALLLAGVRMVTYDTHFVLPSAPRFDAILESSSTGGLLKMLHNPAAASWFRVPAALPPTPAAFTTALKPVIDEIPASCGKAIQQAAAIARPALRHPKAVLLSRT